MKDETFTCSENKQEVFPSDMFELNYILYFTSYVNLTEKPTAAPVFSSLSSGTWFSGRQCGLCEHSGGDPWGSALG